MNDFETRKKKKELTFMFYLYIFHFPIWQDLQLPSPRERKKKTVFFILYIWEKKKDRCIFLGFEYVFVAVYDGGVVVYMVLDGKNNM